ncbi:MAG: cytochrome bc complex cytochrome b subunit [Thermoprotei archaeon]
MVEDSKTNEEKATDPMDYIWRWIEDRTGLKRLILKPQPEFTLFNPHYWLGALAVIAFAVQAVTGFLLMINYVPLYRTLPTGAENLAWESVNNIIHNVPYGSLVASMHLYGAYAMVIIAFVHLVRNFLVGGYKKPRELMWILGIILGFITLLYAFTGYLLPMNTVSYGATSVGVQLASYFPGWIGKVVPSILKGAVFPDDTLNRFFAFHVVLLPILFIIVLGAKIGLVFEAHGASGPVEVSVERGPRNRKVNWYPRLIWYSLVLTLFYLAALFIISAVFPISAGTEYTGGSLGANILPDWYFVWTDIVLRASFFSNQYVLDGLLTMLGVILLLALIPWVDRSPARHPAQRPLISILFVALIGELFALTVYGYLTTTALEIASASEIFEVFVFVPISIILLGLVVYRFSPAYEVNKGKLWAIKPEWNYEEIKREAEAGGMLVPANLYRDQAKLSLEDKPQLDPKDKVQ